MGSSKKAWLSERRREKVPGPGSYSTDFGLGTGPHYGFRAKTATVKVSLVPGPGQYQPEISADSHSVHRSPSVVIGKAQRGNKMLGGSRNGVPGPGSYSASSSFDGRRGVKSGLS